jgi:hypothetical protein
MFRLFIGTVAIRISKGYFSDRFASFLGTYRSLIIMSAKI